MQTPTYTSRRRLLACVATLATGPLTVAAVARDHIVTVAIQVSARGLDLSRPADAQTFYTRLEKAAWIACTQGDRVDLLPVDDTNGCRQKALGESIRSAHAPILTQIYLNTHTLREAVALGIEVPVQVAAK